MAEKKQPEGVPLNQDDELREQVLGSLAMQLINQRGQEVIERWQSKWTSGFDIGMKETYNPNQVGVGFKVDIKMPEVNFREMLDLSINPIPVTSGPYDVIVRINGFEYPDDESCHVFENVQLTDEDIECVSGLIMQLWEQLGFASKFEEIIAEVTDGDIEPNSQPEGDDGWLPIPENQPPSQPYDAAVEFLNAYGLKENDRVVWVTEPAANGSPYDKVISWEYYTRTNMDRRASSPGYVKHGEFRIIKIVSTGIYSMAYLVKY